MNDYSNGKKGKILRVKHGYNPNSSSVGSLIPVFLAFSAGAGIITVTITNILAKTRKHIMKNKDSRN